MRAGVILAQDFRIGFKGCWCERLSLGLGIKSLKAEGLGFGIEVCLLVVSRERQKENRILALNP